MTQTPDWHVLKCWPVSFNPVIERLKTFEIRKADRDYKVGDWLVLREFVPCARCHGTGRHRSAVGSHGETEACCDCDDNHGKFTRMFCRCKVNHIFQGGQFGLESGYIAMSITLRSIGMLDAEMMLQPDILDDFFKQGWTNAET